MKLKLCACLALVGMLASATSLVAAPVSASFLKVDVNGANIGGAQSPGPTASGYQGWALQEGLLENWSSSTNAAGVTQVFATGQGNITATLTGRTAGSRSARNRGDTTGPLNQLYQDFVYATRVADGFGQHWLKLELSGLTPNQQYEFTGFTRDYFNGTPDSYQSWTDLAQLGGLDGPGAWMDANVGVGATYQPAIGGVSNPIPKKGRLLSTGPAPVADYDYSISFNTLADATGKVTVFTYADPNSYSGTQTVSMINGFELGPYVPEPASAGLLMIGLLGAAGFQRRTR